MACFELRLKAAQSTKGEKNGEIAMYIALVFNLQTRSIVLPRSLSLGVRGGLPQAFGLSLKEKCDIFIRGSVCKAAGRHTF